MTYRTAPGACVSCSTPLEPRGRRLGCPSCRSCLVPEADVDDAIRAMGRHGERGPPLPSITPLTGGFAGARRPCPKCAAVMTPCLLASVPIDQCAAHGLWFDHDELERVLLSRAPTSSPNDVTAVEAAGGVLEGLGGLLEILAIFG